MEVETQQLKELSAASLASENDLSSGIWAFRNKMDDQKDQKSEHQNLLHNVELIDARTAASAGSAVASGAREVARTESDAALNSVKDKIAQAVDAAIKSVMKVPLLPFEPVLSMTNTGKAVANVEKKLVDEIVSSPTIPQGATEIAAAAGKDAAAISVAATDAAIVAKHSTVKAIVKAAPVYARAKEALKKLFD